MGKESFKQFAEQKLGKVSYFLVFVVLEWILIAMLFVDGLIAFAANEFAHFFGLEVPCLLCTRIDHVLVHRDHDFYYNDSICGKHKRDVSSLAYCHVHRKISDIRQMCEGCLFSFATEDKSNCETYKSLVGILGADLECSVEEDHKIHLRLPAGGEKGGEKGMIKNSIHQCSCCGEPLRVKTSYSKALVPFQETNVGDFLQAPVYSPRVSLGKKNEESRGVDPLPHIRYTELKILSDTDSEVPEEEEGAITLAQDKESKESLLTEYEESNEDSCKTPNIIRANRFFGIHLTDSATSSPRWNTRLQRRPLGEIAESSTESLEGSITNETDGETILHKLKRQVRLDRKSLIALYMELDEERSASAVAANEAMAMITRLQAEKAAMHMEASQYQRMMEEQAEFDQEDLQVLKDVINKKDEEIEALEAEMKSYREKAGFEFHTEGTKARARFDLSRSRSDITTSKNGWCGEALLDQEGERRFLLDRLKLLEKIHSSSKLKDSSPDSSILSSSGIINFQEYRGKEWDDIITKEISHLSNRLRAIEKDREFLKHAFQSLQKGDEGTQLLREIAQHLRELRFTEKTALQVVS
ncbi:hypothetical protein GIB67_005841 [Kingdonia uniflora]|uniref:GTD-binding domain-containing protein n=1 Tax=Kingdonia uniflora TaxID=39325 RepID=A0A7J7LU70_9MAGN|nr:hypothetical protein GIB67_005841 [Kingdonia uniflora]